VAQASLVSSRMSLAKTYKAKPRC